MPAPAAPVISLSVEGVGGSLATITTTWGAVAGATSYKFFYGQDDPTTPNDLDDAAVSPLAVGFDSLHIWYIRVKAHNASGDSAFSNLVGFRPGQVPRAPTLAAVLDGDTAATLTWAYVGNEDVNAYAIYRGLTANPIDLLANTLGPAPYEDTGLDAGTTYHYRVTATNAHGESLYSNDVTITTPASAPDAPVLAAVTQVDDVASLGLSWPAVDGATSYKLYRGVTVDPTTLLDAAAGTPYVDAGLTPGTTYHYRAKAHSAGGDSDYSNDVSAVVDYDSVTVPGPTLAAPILKARVNSEHVIRLDWDTVSGATAYRLYRKSGGAAYAKVADVMAPAIRAYNAVTPDVTYMYKVVALEDGVGRSGDSNEVEITQGDRTAESPTNALRHARHAI